MARARIERIASDDATLLMYTGHWVTVTRVGGKTPAILHRAVRRYARVFEARFARAL